jgi:hypothetical protein
LPIEVHRSKEHLYLTIRKFGFFDQTMMDETGAGACPIGHCQAGQDQANVAGPYQDSPDHSISFIDAKSFSDVFPWNDARVIEYESPTGQYQTGPPAPARIGG